MQLSVGRTLSSADQTVGSSLERGESSLLFLGLGASRIGSNELLRSENHSAESSRTVGENGGFSSLTDLFRTADLRTSRR